MEKHKYYYSLVSYTVGLFSAGRPVPDPSKCLQLIQPNSHGPNLCYTLGFLVNPDGLA